MKFLIVLITAFMLVLATPAWAEISRDAAVAAVQKSSGGRVLAVDRTEREGRPVWRVKVLTPQGEIKAVLIDVATGRTL
jgi:uncharacterized membrane protein YkoI